MNLPVVNSHDSWSQLEEVWLGDVYPADWYDHLPNEFQDVLCAITESTKADLTVIEKKLVEFGITVRRPEYTNIDDFVNDHGQLLKPEISPGDHFMSLGTNLLIPVDQNITAWKTTIDQYRQDPNVCVVGSPDAFILNSVNVRKLGQEIIVDFDVFDTDIDLNSQMFQQYSVIKEKNGKYLNNSFAAMRPKLLMANSYQPTYDKLFPSWERIFLDRPIYCDDKIAAAPGSEFNGKFYNSDFLFDRAFNQSVLHHAAQWAHSYSQTHFKLNCLMLNQNNVLMSGYNENLEYTLRDYGIFVHWMPFRCQGFWDTGIHTATVDIRRRP